MQLDKRTLIYPAIYRHFKGKCYATMGTSKPINSHEILSCAIDPVSAICMHAEHTEIKEAIAIFQINDGWFHFDEKCNKEIVLYKSLYDNHGVYARDVDMFLSEIDSTREDNVTSQDYRFELVKIKGVK